MGQQAARLKTNEDLVNKQVAKKMVGQSNDDLVNEIASINRKEGKLEMNAPNQTATGHDKRKKKRANKQKLPPGSKTILQGVNHHLLHV